MFHTPAAPEAVSYTHLDVYKRQDLIITQKVSNVSKKMPEITICARLLAAQRHPIGIYFISEDLFTLASYYQEDLRDIGFLPDRSLEGLPENWAEERGLTDD